MALQLTILRDKKHLHEKSRVASFYLEIVTLFLTIVSLDHHSEKKSQHCKFVSSCNPEKKSCNNSFKHVLFSDRLASIVKSINYIIYIIIINRIIGDLLIEPY